MPPFDIYSADSIDSSDPIREALGLTPIWVHRRNVTEVTNMPVDPSASEDTAANSAFEEKVPDWEALKTDVRHCTRCALCETRTQTVFGVGDEKADWMLVGEAPGAQEDARGEPFVGQAGQLLDDMLRAVKLSRKKGIYIANVIKCRPPGNRNPKPEEIEQCADYLKAQLAFVRPKLIVALGRFAAQTLLDTQASIGALRQRVHQYENIPVIVTYHPAYLLRNLPDKAKAWADLCFAQQVYCKQL
jgi:DNA polymerase